MALMRATRGRRHETDWRLIDHVSIAVEQEAIQQILERVAARLAQLNMHPAARSRLITTLAAQLASALESVSDDQPEVLRLHIYTSGVHTPSAHGWGFFIVSKPPRTNRRFLDVFVYRDPPV